MGWTYTQGQSVYYMSDSGAIYEVRGGGLNPTGKTGNPNTLDPRTSKQEDKESLIAPLETSNVNSATGQNEKKGETESIYGTDPEGWREKYYTDYAQKMAKVGGTPVDAATFFTKYSIGTATSGTMFGDAADKYTEDIVQTGIDIYNQKAKEYSDLTNTPPENYSGGKTIDSVVENITKIGDTLTYYKDPEHPERIDSLVPPEYERSEDTQKYIDELNAELAKEDSQFEKPTFNPEVVQGWYNKLSEWEKPAEDRVITQANEQYNFLNPYGVGSGSQIKATNELTQGITSDRLGRASSIAEGDYNKDYEVALNKWNYLTAKHDAALDKLGSIATWESSATLEPKLGNFWKEKEIELAEKDVIRKRQWDKEDLDSYQKWQTNLAKSMQPKEQDWFSKYVSPILSAGVSGLTGGFGQSLGTSIFGTPAKTTTNG
jgi:hypothetical protein